MGRFKPPRRWAVEGRGCGHRRQAALTSACIRLWVRVPGAVTRLIAGGNLAHGRKKALAVHERPSGALRCPGVAREFEIDNWGGSVGQSSKRVHDGEPSLLAINLPSRPAGQQPSPHGGYPKHFKGICWTRPLRLETLVRGGARSTPGFSPDPKFSLANSPVSPLDRLRLLTAPSNTASRSQPCIQLAAVDTLSFAGWPCR